MKINKTAILLMLIIVLTCISSCVMKNDDHVSNEYSSPSEQISNITSESVSLAGKLLTVHYLDVGQGDSIFIELPNKKSMLIDASISKYEERIVETISELGYNRIDYVIATHPHADHIGGMQYVIESFEIGCVYMPDVSATTKTYTELVETILQKNIEANIAENSVIVFNEENIKAEFLAPFEIDESDQNKNSAVLLLTYQDISFLFMGDADLDIENKIKKVDCDVLKVGHHGSRTASGEPFLKHVSPIYAIISCGEGNTYGHPHAEAVERLEACGAKILRTDQLGTIAIQSNGKELSVYYEIKNEQTHDSSSDAESAAETSFWILNTNTRKIHYEECQYAKTISESNRQNSSKTIEELLAEGYTSCSSCKPHD